jgi:uncharacterized protein YdcH (DUF465 family)
VTNKAVQDDKKDLPSFKTLKEMINRTKVSRQVYIVRDCTFDFSKSQNVKNQIKQGGWNDSSGGDPETLSFDIYYKSVERTFFADLFQATKKGAGGAMSLPTHNLIYRNENGSEESYYRDQHEKLLYNRFEYEKQGVAKPGIPLNQTDKDQGDDTQNKTFFGGLLEKAKDKLIDTVNKNINQLKDRALQEFRQARGKLLDGLFQELRDVTQVPAIQPDNVYHPDFGKLTLENFVKGLGADLYNDVEQIIRGETNDFFNDIGL